MMRQILLTVATWMIGMSAHAAQGVYLGFDALYSSGTVTSTTNGVSSEAKSTSTLLDVDLGYVFSSGLYAGALYSSASSDDGFTNPNATATGVGVGFMGQSFFIMGQMYLNAQIKSYSSSSDHWSEGTGFGVIVGYLLPVNNNVAVGGSLGYRTIEYKAYNNGTAFLDEMTLKRDETSPRLIVAFMF